MSSATPPTPRPCATASCTVPWSSTDRVKEKARSIGRAVFHVEARIAHDADKDARTDEVGELVLRRPNVFTGYWGLPDATAEAFRGGWFHTGDLGRMDAEGFITLVDRKKDMIITGGENVYPIEVEQQVGDPAATGSAANERLMAIIPPLLEQ